MARPFREIKSMRILRTGHAGRMGEWKNKHKISVWKPEGRKQLCRRGRRIEDNIKTDPNEIGYDDVE
jgi:hypothetical protein